jgi:AraC family transcriptional regulator
MITNLVYLRPVSVVTVRITGAYSASAAKAWDLMSNWLRTSGAISDVTPRYGLLLDDPRLTAPNDCRYEACIALTEGCAHLPRGFKVKRIPYGPYTRARHVGGEVGLAHTLSQIRSEWMSDNGLVPDPERPMIEIYLDNPSSVPIAQQRIDVCLPVMFPAHQTDVAPSQQAAHH